MSITNLFPNKEQFDTMNILLAAIANGSSEGLSVKNFESLQHITRLGLADKLLAVGDQIETERATSVSTSIGESTGIKSVTIDDTKLINALGSNLNGTFVLTYDGALWLNQIGVSVTLSNWGISVTGTPAKDDTIIINITAKTLVFDVLDFNKHTPKNKNLKNSVALGMHDVFTYGTIPFCASQLMYYTVGGLPAGKYKFTLDHARYGSGTEYDGTYMFTTTQDIPATGGFRHTNPIGGWKEKYAQSDVIGNYITTYGASPLREEIERGLAVSIWDGTTACTDLGTFTSQNPTYYVEDDKANNGKRNLTERQAYGSNRWRDSVYRMWLNSDAPAVDSSDMTTISYWWTPKSVFDRVPNGAKLAGFLHGLDPTFVEAMGEVEVITALSNTDKTGTETYDVTYDKVFLQSMTEVFGGTNNGVAEGSQLEYWVDATNEDRIKYENNTARYWWLRSPYPSNADYVRGVDTSGALGNIPAGNASGVVPACCII